ncbi:MAG TPA: cytochrome c biogenesis protein CcdA [Candidatus Solibacter sp.]|jgi:cytochrome c-type biogenesis protein|nr:cytochrome c biogenesis protein CcdA [Candidatus Solibacter sp.]
MLTSVDPIAAFAGGLLSFLSPCVLALVPGYLAYLGGTSVENGTNRRTMVINAGIFVAGFSAVFILLFAVFRALVVDLPIDYKNLLTEVGAVIIIFLGLQFLGLFRVPFLQREGRLSIAHRLQGGSPLSALLVGMTFGLGWTPCVGPILTFIILRASSHDLVGGVGLMVLYCAGLAVPFLTVSLLLDRVRPVMRQLNAHARLVESASGGLLVVVGLLLFTGQFALIPQWFGPLARYLPQG